MGIATLPNPFGSSEMHSQQTVLADKMTASCLVVDPSLCVVLACGAAFEDEALFPGIHPGLLLSDCPGMNIDHVDLFVRALAGERVEGSIRLGEYIFQICVTPSRDAMGRVCGAVGVGIKSSVSDAQQNLDNHALCNLLDNAQDGIFIIDRNFVVQRVNPVVEQLEGESGKPPITGEVCYKRFFDSTQPCTFCPVVETFRTGKPAASQCFHPRLNRHFSLSCSPLFDLKTGELIGAFETIRDITDLRKFEQEAKALRHGMLLLDSIPMCCALFDENLRLVDCNAEGIRFLQCVSKAEVRAAFFRLFPERQSDGRRSADVIRQDILSAFSEGYLRREWLYRLRDGTSIPADVTLIRLRYEGQTLLAVYSRDLRDIKKMELALAQERAELVLAKEAAENALAVKSSFLANMSHEIRTPMNAILGLTYIALQREMPAIVRDYVNKIRVSATGLLSIINDILDFSKIEANRLSIERAPFVLCQQMAGVLDMFQLRAAEKGIDITISIDPRVVRHHGLMGDAVRLRQILVNLIGNAVKFTERGGVALEVEIVEESTASVTLCFSVYDTGIGMDDATLETIFTPFLQADASITRRFGGTGLGLAITHQLVELMDGQLTVESTPGYGSVFSFTLPFPLAPNSCPINENAKPVNRDFSCLRGRRVLVVEDNEINQMVAQNLLEMVGMKVQLAANGLEAVEAVHASHFDCVLMDIQMPVLDGFEATRRIRALPNIPSTLPIIAMTAHAMRDDFEKSLEAGMNDHITKPINPDEMFRTLSDWLCDE